MSTNCNQPDTALIRIRVEIELSRRVTNDNHDQSLESMNWVIRKYEIEPLLSQLASPVQKAWKSEDMTEINKIAQDLKKSLATVISIPSR